MLVTFNNGQNYECLQLILLANVGSTTDVKWTCFEW